MNKFQNNNSFYGHHKPNFQNPGTSPSNFKRDQNLSAPQNHNYRYEMQHPPSNFHNFSGTTNYSTYHTAPPLHAAGYARGQPAVFYPTLEKPYTQLPHFTPRDLFQQLCQCPKSGLPSCRHHTGFQSIDIHRHNDYIAMECTNELCDHAKITLHNFTDSDHHENTRNTQTTLDENIHNKYYDHPILIHRACQNQLENELISILKNSSSTVGYSDKDRKARLWDNFSQWSVIPEFAQLVRCWKCQESGRIGHLRVNLTFNHNKFVENCENRKKNQHLTQANVAPLPSLNRYQQFSSNPTHPSFNQAGPLRFNAVYPPGNHASQNSPKVQRGQEKYHFQPQATSPYSQYQKQNYNNRIHSSPSLHFRTNNFQNLGDTTRMRENSGYQPKNTDLAVSSPKLATSPQVPSPHNGLLIEAKIKSPEKDLGLGESDEDNSFPLKFDPVSLPKVWSIPAISSSFNSGTLSNINIEEPWLIQDSFNHYDNNYSLESEIEWRQAKQRQNKLNQQGHLINRTGQPPLTDKELRTLHSIPDAVEHTLDSFKNLNLSAMNVTQFEAITHVDFPPRKNFDDFKNLLHRKQINPYDIMMEAAEGGQANSNQIGIDNLRTHILSNLSQCHCQVLACVICEEEMPVYHHFPLISGLMYLSTETTTFKKSTSKKVQLENDGEHYNLYAICLQCCKGLNREILCNFCHEPWNGSVFQLGTLYMYDVFACFPCCQQRKLCKECQTEIPIPKTSSFDSFSQKIACPNCKIKRCHLVHSSDTFSMKLLDPNNRSNELNSNLIKEAQDLSRPLNLSCC